MLLGSVGKKALTCIWGSCGGGTGLGGHGWSEHSRVRGGGTSPWAALPGVSGDGIWVSFPSFLPSLHYHPMPITVRGHQQQ